MKMSTDKEKHVTPSEFNRAIKERIEYLEQEEPDNPELYKLKLLQSDNISEYYKSCIIFSMQDIQDKLYILSYMDHLHKHQKEGGFNHNEYSSPFCQIALDKGFVTEPQLSEALAEQAKDDLSNKPHRFIGRMLFEDGWITNKQINFVYYIMQDYTAPL